MIDWHAAPIWARWAATDLLGLVWFEYEPYWQAFTGWQRTTGRAECLDGCYTRQLEQRAQELNP